MQKVHVKDVDDNEVVSITEIKKVKLNDELKKTKKYGSLNQLIKEIYDADLK